MKLASIKTAFFLLLTTAAFSSSDQPSIQQDNPGSNSTHPLLGKIYIRPGDLLMDAEKLYVSIENQLYDVSSVFCDDLGVYVAISSFEERKMAFCPEGHPNPPWNLVCALCGKPLY